MRKTRTVNGYKVEIAGAGSQWAASYAAPFHTQGVVGRGTTVAEAIADLERVQAAYMAESTARMYRDAEEE